MNINYRKLKKQIHPIFALPTPTGRCEYVVGYLFQPTDDQFFNKGLYRIQMLGNSKTSFMKAMKVFIRHDEDFRKEFTL